MLINPKQPIIRQIREGEYEYQADLYDAKVFFNDPQADNHNHLMKIVKYDKELIFKMLNVSPTNITVDKDNQLTYHNVFEGVDTVYTLYPDKVKEDIIINSPEAEHVFKFRVYESLPATMQDSGDIFYYDTDNDNQKVFELPAPYATDTNNNTVDVEMIHEEGYYTYKVIPDKDTVYPIVLDPTVGVAVSYTVTSVNIPAYKKGKYEDTVYMYLNDFGIKIKNIRFSLYINYTSNASANSEIKFYNEENTLLKTITPTKKGEATYPAYDITDDINKIIFYSMASNDRQSSTIYSSANNGISSILYDSEDGYIPKANITKEVSTNIITINFTSTMKMNVNDISFLSFTKTDEPQDISINSITVNNNDVDINNFSIESGDSVIIKAYSPNCMPKLVGLRYVGTQEHQLLNVNEKIIPGGHELLSMNENTIEVGNNQFNLEENVINGGNSDINTKELIYANESSELSININVGTSLRRNIPVYYRYQDTGARDSSSVIRNIFDSELANYVKTLGFDVKSNKSCGCFYTDYNDNNHSFALSSEVSTHIFDNNGIKIFDHSIAADTFTILSVSSVDVDRLDANLEPDFFVYNDAIIDHRGNYIVKIVGGDIYEIIDPSKITNSHDKIDPDNLKLLDNRNKILLRTNTKYYIKHNECYTVGVFRYEDNVTIENSLLSMNEKICNGSNVELIENIYATEKSEIQTMEYIIKDNEYQLLNVKEEIMYSGQELAGNNQFNLEEYVAKGGNSDIINTKETISINSSDIFDINEKIYGIEKEKIPLIEKITSDANSDLIDIKELVSISDDTVIDIKENIQLARDLNIIEKVFIKDSILLPITEGIVTNNDSLIRILENVKNSSEDRFDIKEYIATSIGEEKLDIIEKIPTSDETVINIIENIMIDGYSCIPIEENIVINDNSKIDIIERICLVQNEDISLNENIVEKAAKEIVLLEEVKILGNDAVSIIENVKPVSLTIVENIRQEVDYATRLITFTKPTFTYKKGK